MENSIRKKLDYCVNMPMKSYNYTAYMGGVLFAKGNGWKPYYLSKHILLTCNDLFDVTCDDMIMYEDDDVFERKQFNFKTVDSEEMKNEIILKINEGFYASVTVDEFFIPKRHAYKNYSFYHDMLIYGYDLEKNIFYTAGYDDTEHFSCLEHDIDIVVDTILFCLNERKSKPHSHYFRARNEYKQFSLGNVKSTLQKYLASEPINKMTYHGVYGMAAYEELIHKHLCAINKGKKLRRATFSVLIEHKELMLERVKYISEYIKNIDDETIYMYEQIIILAKGIQLSSIKYEITHSDKIGMAIVEKIREMAELEKNAIEKLLLQI